jgi:hypothetical protein
MLAPKVRTAPPSSVVLANDTEQLGDLRTDRSAVS